MAVERKHTVSMATVWTIEDYLPINMDMDIKVVVKSYQEHGHAEV